MTSSATALSLFDETQSPQAKSEVELEWELPVWTSADHSTGYILSRCGAWSVSKDRSDEMISYSAWKRATRLNLAQHLGLFPTADDAKAQCQARANA